jgi:hypothetical protein
MAERRKLSAREEIEPHPGDKRYIRRTADGRIAETVDMHRSLSRDDRTDSKATAKPGQGDRGDAHRGKKR